MLNKRATIGLEPSQLKYNTDINYGDDNSDNDIYIKNTTFTVNRQVSKISYESGQVGTCFITVKSLIASTGQEVDRQK